jgi:DNA-binding transcriptional regulator GbsR (MarR family)
MSTERSAIIDVLENSPEPMTPIQISQETDMKRANVRQLLKKLVIAGEVVIKGRSQYFRAKKDLVNIRSQDHNERENEF